MINNQENLYKLATILLEYEIDEPHSDKDSPTYANITVGKLEDWISSEHFGDCTNQPQVCVRCVAEEVIFKAQYILDRWNGEKVWF